MIMCKKIKIHKHSSWNWWLETMLATDVDRLGYGTVALTNYTKALWQQSMLLQCDFVRDSTKKSIG
jgi:hypothetical protein